jgi:hypothetical protein
VATFVTGGQEGAPKSPTFLTCETLAASVRDEVQTLELDYKKLKKRIKNISSLIEGRCRKKIVFARPLLPFGTVWETYAQ